MDFQTKLGERFIDEKEIITFPKGILGFEEYQRYVILEKENSIFHFLQSLDEPELAFVVIFPEVVKSSYDVNLTKEHIELLKLEKSEDGSVYAIVSVPEEVAEMTVNLQAPLVINNKHKVGAQVVLTEGDYHTRHNVLAEMHANAYRESKQEKNSEDLRETV